MNINSYIKKFGKFAFEERPFNHVDALVLCELSMFSFESVLGDDESIQLKDLDLENHIKEMVYDSPDRRFNKNQIRAMVESPRYRDLAVKYIRREFSIELVNQFYAITIVFPNGDFFVSFRGTDISMIGWKEDFLLATQDTFLAQHQALEYLHPRQRPDDVHQAGSRVPHPGEQAWWAGARARRRPGRGVRRRQADGFLPRRPVLTQDRRRSPGPSVEENLHHQIAQISQGHHSHMVLRAEFAPLLSHRPPAQHAQAQAQHRHI